MSDCMLKRKYLSSARFFSPHIINTVFNKLMWICSFRRRNKVCAGFSCRTVRQDRMNPVFLPKLWQINHSVLCKGEMCNSSGNETSFIRHDSAAEVLWLSSCLFPRAVFFFFLFALSGDPSVLWLGPAFPL